MRRVGRHSIPTLRAITVKEVAGCHGRNRVAPIIGELAQKCVAPKLTRVELRYGSTGVQKAGKAIAAGLWPELEELLLPHCHSNWGMG